MRDFCHDVCYSRRLLPALQAAATRATSPALNPAQHPSGPCPQVPAQKYNAGYLSSKHRRMSHMLNPEMYESSDEQQEPLEGQYCFWDHEVRW